MFIYFLLTSLLAVTEAASSKQERFLLVCRDDCTSDDTGYDSCQRGYKCKPYGCGHTCQIAFVPEGCTACIDLDCYNDACEIAGSGCPQCIGVGRRQEREIIKPCVEQCPIDPILQAAGFVSCLCD